MVRSRKGRIPVVEIGWKNWNISKNLKNICIKLNDDDFPTKLNTEGKLDVPADPNQGESLR